MMADYIIRQWRASYYVNVRKRWVYGQLIVTPDNVAFLENSNTRQKDDPPLSLRLSYEDLSEIKRASSSFVYKALVIYTCAGQIQHWFSSLPNRDSTYNVVEHYWRDRLIPQKNPPEAGKTAMGKELLKIAADSEKTLVEATKSLKRQGEQLENALGLACDVNNDLTIAENLTSNLESWLGRWPSGRVLKKPEAMDFISPKGIPIIHEFPMIYSKPEKADKAVHLRGTLRVAQGGLTLLDCNQYPVHHYQPGDISEIVIISPWDIKVSQLRLGEPESSFLLSSTRMVRVLKALEPVHQKRFQYSEPPVELLAAFQIGRDKSPEQESEKLGLELVDKAASSRLSCSRASDVPRSAKRVSWSSDDLLVQTQEPMVAPTEEEAEALNQMVGRMKNMAIDITSEQERQMDTIDRLEEAVEKADGRLQSQTRKVLKLNK